VVLFCGLVVCLCGLDFVIEISETYVLLFMAYNGTPLLSVLPPTDSSIFRGFSLSELSPVAGVLRVCCQTEIGFSIVQAVMINVVDYEVARRVEYVTVHTERKILFADSFVPYGIEGICILDGMPFVLT